METNPARPRAQIETKKKAVQLPTRRAAMVRRMATGMATMMVVLVLHLKRNPSEIPITRGQVK